ncbi:OLC1v1012554C1 [Oldenlandia corymbosa var. corymbosa]|uniref:OLC1v1012554C1 n=1 Tax=Oldenlandia corymbosa var. corymbosa TaxID=529605 RepID=A0AAV1DW58_OLDCO|nr:OLC1v1012554C1 [Oldenlandia corymbosa var. corymbosa]
MDLERDYFLVKFRNAGDFQRILNSGPLYFYGTYFHVRKWDSFFDPVTDHVKSLTVWARMPGFPVHYYNKNFLRYIGTLLGRVVQIYHQTAAESRGNFTRRAMESRASDSKLPFQSVKIAGTGTSAYDRIEGRQGSEKTESPADKGSTSTQARGTRFDLLISLGDDGGEDQLGAAVPEKMDDESDKMSTPPTQSLSFLGARKASTREQISSAKGGACPLPKTQKKPNMSHNPTEMAQNSATLTQQPAQQVASNPISFLTAETQKAPQAQKEFTAHLAPTTLDLPSTK